MSSAQSDSRNLQSRLGSAEQQIASLAAQQRALTENVNAVALSVREVGQTMASGFQKVDSQIDALGTKLSDQNKPQWQTMIAMFGVIVIVVGWFAKSEIAPILLDLETTKKYVAELRQYDAQNLDQHSQIRERVSRLEEVYRLGEAGLLKQRGSQ